jgi:hypothetical protein
MKLLKAVWAEMTITGKFKGSLQEFAIRNVDHGNKVFAGPKQVTSTFEAMALDPNKLFIDETTMTCCNGKTAAAEEWGVRWREFAGREQRLKESGNFYEIDSVLRPSKTANWISTASKPDPEWPKKEQFEKRYKQLMAMDKMDLVKKINETSRLDMSHLKSESKQDLVYHILGNEGLLRPKKKEKKTADPTASLKKTAGSSIADIFFNPARQTIDCPHCHLPMKTATLNGGLGALFCPNCRHVDYEDKVKSTVNAGSPSVDKSLQFKCMDSGNCQII